MPPKKKKATTKNAFFYYMVDFRAKKESEGVSFPGGLKDVADAASPSWKGLDPKSKQHYENIAERAKVAGTGGVRYTTQGQTFDEVDQERREADERKQTMMRTIQTEVESGGRLGLKKKLFYFIHINHYGVMEEHRYIPCELAFLAYSIERGFEIGNLYHEFIANMEIPNGYTFRAMTHKDATHKCPLPPYAMGTANHQRIYECIIGLIEKNGDLEEGRPPPIYTMSQFIPEAVDFFLKGNQFLHDIHHVTRIYPLEELFFRMKNFGLKPQGQHLFFNGIEDKGFPFITNAADILKGDVYDYSPGIACQFHEDEDVRQHCSRSYVIRWSYLLSDHVCANLDVKIESERHTPRGTDLHAVKITREVDQLRLRDAIEAPRESCGRGKPVEGRSVPTSRPIVLGAGRSSDSWASDPYSRSPSQMSNASSRSGQREFNRPLTIIDHSKNQPADEDDAPAPAPPRPMSEDAPLRAPKTKGKSSMLLTAMQMTASTVAGNGLDNPVLGRGRGRGVGIPPGPAGRK